MTQAKGKMALVMCMVMALSVSAGVVFAQDTAGFINVKGFGSKGDGKTDDTEAIRAAVKAAFEQRKIPQHPQYGYFVSFSEVYFPNGHYLISDTIDISYVKIRGENYAAIEQKNPEKDIFYTHDAWRQLIEGLTFLGGKVQLNLGNPNVNTGHVTVRDCHFYYSGAAAVQMRKGSNSSFFKVENCIFRECEQAVINYCDLSVMRDCWISSSPKMKDKAVIENRGFGMYIESILGVPAVNNTDQRWIDNYGSVRILRTRFGGEHGGFTAVVNFAVSFKTTDTSAAVTLDQCYIYSVGNPKRKCGVYLEEVPSRVSITDCVGFESSCAPIMLSPKADVSQLVKKEPGAFQCTFWGNTYPVEKLPKEILPYTNLFLSKPMQQKASN